MSLHYFIIISATILVLERLLPLFISFPIIFFPLFAIIFLIRSRNYNHDFTSVVVAGVFFDFFSGYEFGEFTLVMAFIGLAVFLIKKEFTFYYL